MKSVIGPVDINLRMQAAATVAATQNSPVLDLAFGNTPFADSFPADGEGQVMQLIVPVTSVKVSATNETYTFVVQSSPDQSTWTNCSRTASVGTGTITEALEGGTTGPGSFSIDFNASNRYLRLVQTLGGTSPSIVLGDIFISPYTNSRT
jgi:hypothetical protein